MQFARYEFMQEVLEWPQVFLCVSTGTDDLATTYKLHTHKSRRVVRKGVVAFIDVTKQQQDLHKNLFVALFELLARRKRDHRAGASR